MERSAIPDSMRDELRGAWHRYIDAVIPVRPALHAYRRRLTGSLWKAEDLVQDALLRAFGQWGVTSPAIRARAYLLGRQPTSGSIRYVAARPTRSSDVTDRT